MKLNKSKYSKLRFDYSENFGQFVWGKERAELFDRFYDAAESLSIETTLKEMLFIIRADPEFIDVYNHLGWLEMTSNNYGNSTGLYKKAYKIGNSLIPKTFKGQIIWGITENRPFLRTLHGLGLCYLSINEFEKALKYFKVTLKYNPDDNQGIRAAAIHCNIALGNFNEVLKICKDFPSDVMPDTMYGKVLSLYRLDKLKEAEEALKEAVEYLPLVAKEIVSKKHKEVFNDLSGTITVGGADEAYDYWKRLGHCWNDPKLKEFIKSCI